MNSRNRTARRCRPRLFGERLEDRWLLSGLSPFADVSAEPDLPYEPDAESSVVRRSDMPLRVVETMDGMFPGWTLAEADVNVDAGVSRYALTAEWRGVPVLVTLTQDGRLSDSEQDVDLRELPPALQQWVRQTFPGAVVGEVARVSAATGVSYELSIVTADGEQFETTLYLDVGETRTVSPWPTSDVQPAVGMTADQTEHAPTESMITTPWAAQGMALSSRAVDAAHADGTTSSSASDAASSLAPDNARETRCAQHAANSMDASVGKGEPAVPADGSRGSTPLGLDVAQARGGPSEWLPAIAGALCEHVSTDAAAMEQSLEQFISDLDALADLLVGEPDGQSIGSRVAVVTAIAAGAQFVGLRVRRSRRELMFGGPFENASWSWVLGSGPTGW